MNSEELNKEKETIKSAVDIVSFIDDTHSLTLSGDEWKGYTEPGSKSKSSLSVNKDKQVYDNHATGDSGDIFNWVAYRENLDITTDFPKILAVVADYAGIKLTNNCNNEERDQVCDTLRVVVGHYHTCLNGEWRQYVSNKWGISNETIDKLQIGYAPANDPAGLQMAMKDLIQQDDLVKAGMVYESKIDIYRGRIIFPYWKGGKIVYTIGRATELTPANKKGNTSKYLKQLVHKKENPLVSTHINNDVFYGVDSIKGADEVIITEGVTDCISMSQAGIPCISPVTVAFKNEDRPKLLQLIKGIKNIYLCNDNDGTSGEEGPGDKGAFKTIEYLNENGLEVRHIRLPRTDDVDKIDLADYMRVHTVKEFRGLMDMAVVHGPVKIDTIPETTDKSKTLDEKYTANIIKNANHLLDSGEALEFILWAWNRRHVGDWGMGASCAAAAASTLITNTGGLHIKPSGDSGKGKSGGMMDFLHLLPDEAKISASLSGKAVYYDDDVKKGTIIFSDDTTLNDDMVDTIKRATTNYQEVSHHHTVTKNREGMKLEIPERISWWLTTVNSFDDDQMGNRFITCDVDGSPKQDEIVFKRQIELELAGVTRNTVDDVVLTCRAIFSILRDGEYKIVVPYSDALDWGNKSNRRNLTMFLDIVKSVALYSIRNRELYNGEYLATVDDFHTANKIYKQIAATNTTNLSQVELNIMRYLHSATQNNRQVDTAAVARYIGKSYGTARNHLIGRGDMVGLIGKIPGLVEEKFTKTEDNSTGRITKPKHAFAYTGDKMDIASYGNIAVLDESKVESAVLEFKRKSDNGLFTSFTDVLQAFHNKPKVEYENIDDNCGDPTEPLPTIVKPPIEAKLESKSPIYLTTDQKEKIIDEMKPEFERETKNLVNESNLYQFGIFVHKKYDKYTIDQVMVDTKKLFIPDVNISNVGVEA